MHSYMHCLLIVYIGEDFASLHKLIVFDFLAYITDRPLIFF